MTISPMLRTMLHILHRTVSRRPFAFFALCSGLLVLNACGPRRPHASSTAPPGPALAEDCRRWRDPKLIERLDKKTHSRMRGGNQVTLLINGSRSFARRVENAEDADLILVKTFIFSEDDTGWRLARLLARKAREGAEVFVQYDHKGSLESMDQLAEMLESADDTMPMGEKELIRFLRTSGVHVVATNPLLGLFSDEEWDAFIKGMRVDPESAWTRRRKTRRLLNHGDHEKYWITAHRQPDGRIELRAILGGMNIASEYAYGGTNWVDTYSGRSGWRDTDVEVRGPVTNDIVQRYFEVMDFHTGADSSALLKKWNQDQPMVGNAIARFVWNHPLMDNRRAIEALYKILIDETPKLSPITIETAYFAPSPLLRRALRDALRRGSALTVITNSDKSSDVGVVTEASRYVYARLLRVNPRAMLYEWIPRKNEGEFTLHAKVASFGVCGPALVGSANLDAQSSEHNSESVLLIYDQEFRKAFDAAIARDIQPGHARRIDLNTLEQDGFLGLLKRWSLHMLLWYWL